MQWEAEGLRSGFLSAGNVPPASVPPTPDGILRGAEGYGARSMAIQLRRCRVRVKMGYY